MDPMNYNNGEYIALASHTGITKGVGREQRVGEKITITKYAFKLTFKIFSLNEAIEYVRVTWLKPHKSNRTDLLRDN